MLSPILLERLRVWWRGAQAQGNMLDGGWLIPGLNPIESHSTRQLNRAIHAGRPGRWNRQARAHAHLAPHICWNRRSYPRRPTAASQPRSRARRYIVNYPK
jgi:hypothetical protein